MAYPEPIPTLTSQEWEALLMALDEFQFSPEAQRFFKGAEEDARKAFKLD